MFLDRRDAGERLADALAGLAGEGNLVVEAIPRGGVVVGAVVAQRLDAPLDVVIPRKIGAPGNPELAIGAIAENGTLVLNEEMVRALGVSQDYLEEEKARQLVEIRRRKQRYLEGRSPQPVQGKTVIVVDDGLATGSTALAAVRGLRSEGPADLILAVPVAPRETVERLRPEVDRLLCLDTPEMFYAVGQFYRDFSQTGDEEVIELLRESHRQQEK